MSITNRGVALLGFKLVGLWLMASAAIGVASTPFLWEKAAASEAGPAVVMFSLLPSLVSFAIGLPVWIGADVLASRILADAAVDEPGPHGLQAEPLFALTLSAMGIFFVCEAIPGIVQGFALFVLSLLAGSSILGPDLEQRRAIWSAAAKASALAAVTRLMIGATLVAGPVWIRALVGRVQKELRGSLADEESTKA